MEPKTISGKTLGGQNREYIFNLLSYKDGLRIFHEYGSILMVNLPLYEEILMKLFDKDNEKNKISTEDVMGLFSILPRIFTWDKLESLAKLMLAKCSIQADGKTYDCDNDGMCSLFREDQGEFYHALFYAACVNYPKYIAPFLELGSGDTNTDQEKKQKS